MSSPVPPPNNPLESLSRLTSTPTSVEAAMIVATLEEAGLQAVATGRMTTNTQLASGEWVEVMVADSDLPVARNMLIKLKQSNAEIDWSKIDVGEPE